MTIIMTHCGTIVLTLPPSFSCAGNRVLMLKRPVEGDDSSPTKAAKGKKAKGEGEPDTGMGFVMYNGGVVDIQSIMQRLEKSEKTRTATEAKLKDTQEDLG